MLLRRSLLILICCMPLFAAAQMKVTYSGKYGPFPEKPVPKPEPVYSPAGSSTEQLPVQSLAEVGITDPLPIIAIDNYLRSAIAQRAFPGCRVLASKDGKVFYDRAFGYLAYDSMHPVNLNTVYDLASLTKVVSTTLAVMRLYEQKRIDLDKSLDTYLPMTIGTNKGPLPLRALLLHQAGLKAWIPFYKSFYDSTGRLSDTIFHTTGDPRFNQEVARDLYMRQDYKDTIWNTILRSPLENTGKYVYSDLDYYFLAAVVEAVSGKPINRYVSEQFYVPLGLKTTGYQPMQFVRPFMVAPTENDLTFRRQLLTGYVHDPGAALFGGVAGHAGVFSTAGEVAVIFQMLMNGGVYKNKRYFREETVKYFTAYGSAISRRGLGFDKPNASKSDAGPTGDRSSGYTFGHQGFTGTCAWADPQSGVVFVFLSNRVFPSAENNTINKLGVRTKVQDMLCEALNIPVDTSRPEVRKSQIGNLQ